MKLEDLMLYQECLDFENKIYEQVKKIEDSFEKETTGKSLLESSDAISSNIAFGYGRYFFKDKKYYCHVSKGHILKTKGWIIKSNERGLINFEETEMLKDHLEKIYRMLSAFIRSIGNNINNNSNNKQRSSNYNKSEFDNSFESDNKKEKDTKVVNGNSFTTNADEFFNED